MIFTDSDKTAESVVKYVPVSVELHIETFDKATQMEEREDIDAIVTGNPTYVLSANEDAAGVT